MSDQPPGDPTRPAPKQPGAASANGPRAWIQRRAEAALRKPGRVSEALTEPGECHVVLQLIGPKPIHVIAILSQATGLDLISAGTLAQDAPVVVVSRISEASAERVVDRLQKAGAKAVVGEQYKP